MSNADVKILLVDDNPANLLTMRVALEPLGRTLISASSGREALRRVLEHDFATIVLDVHMPDLNGFETAQLIRSRDRSKDIPIIFVSAVYTDSDDIQLGYETGAVDYLLKPFKPNILRSKVEAFSQLFLMHREVVEKTEALAKEREAHLRTELAMQHYHDLVDRLDHAIVWEADAAMKISFVSHRAEELLGYPAARWVEDSSFFIDHVPPADRLPLTESFARAVQRRSSARCEHRMIARDGRELWCHTGMQQESAVGQLEERIRGLTVDITPLKLEQEALERRAAAAHVVLESRLVGELLADTRGTISSANDRFLEIAGYSRDEIAAGKIQLADLAPIHGGFPDAHAARELAENGTSAPCEQAWVRKDGARVPVLVGAAMVPGSAGEVACFVVDLRHRRHGPD